MATGQSAMDENLRIDMDVPIAASRAVVFQTITTRFGEWLLGQQDEPMGLTLEAWPGGRLWRDLGNGAGHLWGHVQVIKPPALLELTGPLFVSAPSLSHVAFRLEEDTNGTLLKFTHRVCGVVPDDMRTNVRGGWESILAGALKTLCEGESR